MIPLSTNVIRFTPQWLEGQPDAPVYLIRPGSVFERDELEAELVARRAGRVYDALLYEAAREGVRAWKLEPGDLDAVLELIDQHQAGQLDDPVQVTQFGKIEAALREAWPPYQELCAQRARRNQFAPTIAAQMFLRGFEGLTDGSGPVPFVADFLGRPTPETLARIPSLHLKALGAFAYGLLYGETQAGNSGRGSKSSSDPQTTPSDDARPAARKAGKPTASTGRKTPSTSSRRSSGA